MSNLFTVIFVTLIERKFLGVLNNRKSPNLFFLNRFIQSLIDFLKLVIKKILKINFIIKFYWFIIIFYGIIIFFITTKNYPINNSLIFIYRNFFSTFIIYTIISYFFLVLCYRSRRIYSIISLYRVLTQIIRYEVGLIFIFLLPIIILNEINFFNFNEKRNLTLTLSIPFIITAIIIFIREINRIPFDFLERETELVSGFNTEYIASLFSFIFLIEYGFFTFIIILVILIFNINFTLIIIIILIVLWTRSFIPRYRYDKIIYLFWKDLVLIIFSSIMLINLIYDKY